MPKGWRTACSGAGFKAILHMCTCMWRQTCWSTESIDKKFDNLFASISLQAFYCWEVDILTQLILSTSVQLKLEWQAIECKVFAKFYLSPCSYMLNHHPRTLVINPHPSILSPQSPAAASAISWIVHCHESGCLDFHQSIINQLLSHPPSQQYTHLASSFNSPFHPLSCHSMELPLQCVFKYFFRPHLFPQKPHSIIIAHISPDDGSCAESQLDSRSVTLSESI